MKQKDWWRGAVIYQIYPRSFKDSNGDGIGDLNGITEKLPYIADLGVDAIWISPFFKSPMKDFGYDVSDYYDVDPIFGNIEDFKKLINEAHSFNIKVLIDQVWSHCSKDHAWFKESAKDKKNSKHDWFVWADPKPDGTAPNNWLSYFGGPAWTWDSQREQYYLHHFLPAQPNLNLWNPNVRQTIKDISSFWLNLGVDGFRLDAIQTYLSDKNLRDNPPCLPNDVTDIPTSNPMSRQKRIYTSNLPETFDFIEEIRNFVDQWPNKCLLAEVGGEDADRQAARYTQGNKRSHLAYSFGLVGSSLTKSQVMGMVDKIEKVIDDGWICWATSNHDYKRVASRPNWGAPTHVTAKIALAISLSLRGSYCMYQGEELGLPQAELELHELVDPYDIMLYPNHVGRDGCRTPMPWDSTKNHLGFSETIQKTWLPVSSLHKPLSVNIQEIEQSSLLHFTKKFLQWRKEQPTMIHGDINLIEVDDGDILIFERVLNSEKILCAYNLSGKFKKLNINNNHTLELKPYEFMVGNFQE
jgi:alpha-glucosidase